MLATRQIASLTLFRAAFTSLAIALSTLAFPASAQTQDTDIRPNANQLTGDQIKADFSNVSMDGAYNFGRNGRASSFYKEDHEADGTVTYIEDGHVEPGRWFVRKDAICYMYPSNQLAGGCFRVYQVKNCYYFYSSTRPQAEYELGENYWTARSVKSGQRAACDPALS